MKKESAYVKLERSREFRLWITQVGIPIIGGILYVQGNPELKRWVSNTVEGVKEKAKSLFEKNKSFS